jgi:4-hydroxy-4-methyl-2-oxoglutarate aldolase
MIEEPPLLTIKSILRRPNDAQIAAFQGVPTGFVADALCGGVLGREIQPIGDGRDIDCVAAGPALTADCGPADILATQAALNFIRRGDVVVAASAGHQGCATIGDRVAGMMKNDGPVRDYAGIVAAGLPVWCTGLTPASPYTKGPGWVGFPVQIGGQTVENGDMIVADRDGVVVVPFDRIDEIIVKVAHIAEAEAALDAKVAAGQKVSPKVADLLDSDQVRYAD